MNEKKMMVICKILAIVLGVMLFVDIGLLVVRYSRSNRNTETTSMDIEAVTIGEPEETNQVTVTEMTTSEIEITENIISTQTDEETTEQATVKEPVAISIQDIPELDQLYDCMSKFENYSVRYGAVSQPLNYSCDAPPDDLLNQMIDGDGTYAQTEISDLKLAPDYRCQVDQITYENLTCARYSAKGIEWIEKNVLNLSDNAIKRLKDACPQDGINIYDTVYIANNEYCIVYDPINGAVWCGCHNEITDAKYDGTYYYLTTDAYDEYEYESKGNSIAGMSPYLQGITWKLQLKTVDGVIFWSIYECHSS